MASPPDPSATGALPCLVCGSRVPLDVRKILQGAAITCPECGASFRVSAPSPGEALGPDVMTRLKDLARMEGEAMKDLQTPRRGQ